MATLDVQRIAITGLVPTLAAVDAGLSDAVKPSPQTFIWVANADAGAHTVTLDDPRSAVEAVGGVSGVSDGELDVAVSIPAGEFRLIPVPLRFRDPTTGLASWSYDDDTGMTIGAFYLPSGRGAVASSGSITAATQKITQGGIMPSFTAAAASQKIRPGARNFLLVKNADSSDHTITFDDPTSISPVGAVAFNPDVTVNVAHLTTYSLIGAVDGRFADPTDTNRGDITWSATTSMSYAALTI